MVKKICDACGKPFNARTKTQRFCHGDHFATCEICGKEFLYDPHWIKKPHTCSKECKNLYKIHVFQEKYGVDNVSQIDSVRANKRKIMSDPETQNKIKNTCLQKYGYERANQSPEVRKKLSESLKSEKTREKTKRTYQERYGIDHIFKSPEFREKHGCNIVGALPSTIESKSNTFMKKYGVTSLGSIPGVHEKAKVTRAKTCMDRYGEDCIFKTDWFKNHVKTKYGVENAIKNKSVRSKASRNQQHKSNLEIRLNNFLTTYNIEHIPDYTISSNETIHAFDMYLPKYNILIDCDGEYYHAYKYDPNGVQVRDDGDEVRISLVPKDYIFIVLVETDFERGLRDLQKLIYNLDSGVFDYDTELFQWCRSIGFPYYSYSYTRIQSEYKRLCSKSFETYNPNCKICISAINQFHKSIYDAHVDGKISPRQAWDDDTLLKKVIANRLIYQNTVEPSKILQGFNISKIATKVSVFNPVLAKYIVEKYLSEYTIIVDPFSGFSGRLLGVSASGKKYIGSDINPIHVKESNFLIDALHLKDCTVEVSDVLQVTNKSYDAMLTCPPYNTKEIYGYESAFKSCDEWIHECITRFSCRRYVFIIDHTEEFTKNIVEEIKNTSHFSKSKEYIVIIDK